MSDIKNKVINFVKNNDTNILTGVGITEGLFIGSYLWFKTGQKALNIIKYEEGSLMRELTFKEKMKKTWKLFILPSFVTLSSTGLIIYSAKIGNKRLAALGAAYNLTEAAFQRYIDKTKEEIGEKKANNIAEKVSKESIEASENKNMIMLSSDGETWFHEPLTDRMFKTSWTKIQKAANELNAEALSSVNGMISLSEWFYRLGLERTLDSDERGWNPQENRIIDISLDSCIVNDTPCGEIRYNTRPKYFE